MFENESDANISFSNGYKSKESMKQFSIIFIIFFIKLFWINIYLKSVT